MNVNKGVFFKCKQSNLYIKESWSLVIHQLGVIRFSPPILCGHREDFKVLTFSDVFGDLHRMVSRSPPHLFISIEMT